MSNPVTPPHQVFHGQLRVIPHRDNGLMNIERPPVIPLEADLSSRPEPGRANMRYGMPASFEDMVALGLNPLTGEPL